MGYRLYMKDEHNNVACGGKLYGYYDIDFKSQKYLIDKGYITEEDFEGISYPNNYTLSDKLKLSYDCNGSMEMDMKYEDFCEFWTLYISDMLTTCIIKDSFYRSVSDAIQSVCEFAIDNIKSLNEGDKIFIEWS